MIYTKIDKFIAEKSNCGEVVKKLINSQGNPNCMMGYCWIENEDDCPMNFVDSWDWLQSQRKNKKIYILSSKETETKLI